MSLRMPSREKTSHYEILVCVSTSPIVFHMPSVLIASTAQTVEGVIALRMTECLVGREMTGSSNHNYPRGWSLSDGRRGLQNYHVSIPRNSECYFTCKTFCRYYLRISDKKIPLDYIYKPLLIMFLFFSFYLFFY